MSFLFSKEYYEVKKNGISPAQNMAAYLGGSAIQTVGDNPVTAYRQLVQQYAKGLDGKAVDPKIASSEANAVFMASPVAASLSGLWPRLIGQTSCRRELEFSCGASCRAGGGLGHAGALFESVPRAPAAAPLPAVRAPVPRSHRADTRRAGVLFKRVPKFGILLGYGVVTGDTSGKPGFGAATAASILSAPFINPIRMIEKQQRAYMKQTGTEKPIMEIMRESAAKNFAPLFRGTVPLMGHSLASALLGLVGQPRLQKWVEKEVGATGALGQSGTNLVASAVVSPIYVVVTNPLSRLEVIMQTSSMQKKSIGTFEAIGEMLADMREFGLRGIFRGQGIGIAKAIVSLTLFHEGAPAAVTSAVGAARGPARRRLRPPATRSARRHERPWRPRAARTGRIFLTKQLKARNVRNGWVTK